MDVDLEIMPEQFDDRQVGRCVTVRSGVGLQNKPVRRIVRMNEFAHQARLAHPCFTDDRHHLTATVAGKLLGAAELLQFDIAADEARQATTGRGLEASPRGAGARHLIDFHRIGDPLHRYGAKRLHGDVAFRQLGECRPS